MRKLIILGLLFPIFAQAGGIKGTIQSTEGDLLPFATIFVEELNTGTTSNGDAFFELSLPEGDYHLVFQFMGYESKTKAVTIQNDFVVLNVKLQPQVMMLQNVEVSAADEDPAYTIMRKAIAKSKYHQNQVDSYTSTVYLKGTGGLTKIPWLARRQLKKEGIDTSRTFVMESITEVTYERPAIYKENVISIRSDGEANETSPMMYINASFYDKEVAGAVSPLSPRAFNYYRFEYEGTFEDRGYAVSKISVIPRSKGDDVFSGILHIVEDDWSIYSLDLDVIKLGIKFNIKQSFAPIKENVWLPVSHRYFITGSILGFGFQYQYLASISNYQVTLNPDLPDDIIIVDEKKIETDQSINKDKDITEINNNTKMGRKTLRKKLIEYEKEEQKAKEEPDVISERSQKIDSLAYKQDSSYWQQVRPIPLSDKEIRGYQQMDSVALAEKKEERQDSVNTVKRNTFKIQKVITGGDFKLGKKSRLEIDNMFTTLNYNTVEGVNFMYGLRYKTRNEKSTSFSFGPQLRYAWDREVLNGRLNFNYSKFKNPGNSHALSLEGGRFISQYYDEEPITPFLNTLTTLLLERNLMKIYEKDYLRAEWGQKINYKWHWRLQAEYATRYPLQNNADWTLIENKDRVYTSNFPFNAETETEFPQHNALTTSLKISWQPGLKFTKYNDVLQPQYDDAATFTFGYRGGVSGLLDSDVDFNHLYLKVEDKFDLGIRGTFTYTAEAGGFLDEPEYFVDYKHFLGNQTPFLSADLTGRFRLLEYYRFSTSGEYLQLNSNFQWRKFLLTQIPLVRLTGLKENLIFNYLTNTGIDNYMEVGYGIDYIFRILRLEAITSWENGNFRDFGIRIGLITSIEIN